MQVKLFLNSASDLKNVNWRYGNLQPYAIAWIDSSRKCSTKIDVTNGVNPVWNEMFTIPLPLTLQPETAILCIDIVHAIAAANMKPLVGSAKLSLGAALNEARSKGKAKFSLFLERPSGRPQGNLEVQIEFLDSNSVQMEPYGQQPRQMPQQPQPQLNGQQAQYMAPQLPPQPQPQLQPQKNIQQAQYMPSPPQPQLQPHPRPQPQPYVQQTPFIPSQPRPQLQFQPRPQPQNQPRQINQYPMRSGYQNNFPVRPALGQQPGNAMMMQNKRPQNSAAAQIGDALCTLAIGVSPRQIGRMVKSLGRTFQGPQQANGMQNNTGNNVASGGVNVTPGNYPAAQQGYNNAGYDATQQGYDNTGYDATQQGYDNTGYDVTQQGYDDTGYDATATYDDATGYATSDNVGYDGGNFGDGQFVADEGYADGQFGMDGSGLEGCDGGGVDMGMFGDGVFNLGALGTGSNC